MKRLTAYLSKILGNVRIGYTLAVALTVCGALFLPTACSEVDCTNGTVRVVATVPAEALAGVFAIDLAFESAGTTIHTQRLLLAAGTAKAQADIMIQGGYPEGKQITVTAVAKRMSAGGEEPAATWFASQEFPFGCTGFVFTLFPTSLMDGGVTEGGILFPDGAVIVPTDAGVMDASPPTNDGGAQDGTTGDGASNAGDAQGVEAGDAAAPDAPVLII